MSNKSQHLPVVENDFAEIVSLIETARQRANRTVKALASYIQLRQPALRGFSPQNIWRMRQFFETYANEPKLSTLLRALPWSSNLHILTRAKYPEEREFYLQNAPEQEGDL